MTNIALVLLIVSATLLLVYYLGLWVMFSRAKKRMLKCFEGGVSVIVVVRNDTKNLPQLLHSLMGQKCAKYEIILVADRSTIGTVGYLRALQAENDNKVKIVEIDRDTPYPWPGRKFALTLGIRAASYDHIVSLGVGAKVESQNWLERLTAPFSDPKVKIVIAQVKGVRPDGWLAKVFYYLSYGKGVSRYFFGSLGMPYSGDADNFAFEKEMFMSGSGYMNYMKVYGAEADFVIQNNAKSGNTVVNLSSQAQIQMPRQFSVFKELLTGRAVFSYYKSYAKMICLLLPLIKIILATSIVMLLLK